MLCRKRNIFFLNETFIIYVRDTCPVSAIAYQHSLRDENLRGFSMWGFPLLFLILHDVLFIGHFETLGFNSNVHKNRKPASICGGRKRGH